MNNKLITLMIMMFFGFMACKSGVDPATTSTARADTPATIATTTTLSGSIEAPVLNTDTAVSISKASSEQPTSGATGHIYTVEGVDLGTFTTGSDGTYSLDVTIADLKPATATDDSNWCQYVVVVTDDGIKTLSNVCMADGAIADISKSSTGKAIGTANTASSAAIAQLENQYQITDWSVDNSSKVTNVDLESLFSGWLSSAMGYLARLIACYVDYMPDKGAVATCMLNVLLGGSDVTAPCSDATTCRLLFSGTTTCNPEFSAPGVPADGSSFNYDNFIAIFNSLGSTTEESVAILVCYSEADPTAKTCISNDLIQEHSECMDDDDDNNGGSCYPAIVNPPSNPNEECSSADSELVCESLYESVTDPSGGGLPEDHNCYWGVGDSGLGCYAYGSYGESGCTRGEQIQFAHVLGGADAPTYNGQIYTYDQLASGDFSFTLYAEYVGDDTPQIIYPGVFFITADSHTPIWGTQEDLDCSEDNKECSRVISLADVQTIAASDPEYEDGSCYSIDVYWNYCDGRTPGDAGCTAHTEYLNLKFESADGVCDGDVDVPEECGDNICNGDETVLTCPNDCGNTPFNYSSTYSVGTISASLFFAVSEGETSVRTFMVGRNRVDSEETLNISTPVSLAFDMGCTTLDAGGCTSDVGPVQASYMLGEYVTVISQIHAADSKSALHLARVKNNSGTPEITYDGLVNYDRVDTGGNVKEGRIATTGTEANYVYAAYINNSSPDVFFTKCNVTIGSSLNCVKSEVPVMTLSSNAVSVDIAASNGYVYIAATDQSGIYVTKSTNGGTLFAPKEQLRTVYTTDTEVRLFGSEVTNGFRIDLVAYTKYAEADTQYMLWYTGTIVNTGTLEEIAWDATGIDATANFDCGTAESFNGCVTAGLLYPSLDKAPHNFEIYRNGDKLGMALLRHAEWDTTDVLMINMCTWTKYQDASNHVSDQIAPFMCAGNSVRNDSADYTDAHILVSPVADQQDWLLFMRGGSSGLIEHIWSTGAELRTDSFYDRPDPDEYFWIFYH